MRIIEEVEGGDQIPKKTPHGFQKNLDSDPMSTVTISKVASSTPTSSHVSSQCPRLALITENVGFSMPTLIHISISLRQGKQ